MLYIYPSVVYKENDDEPYVMVLPDLNIVAEGDTIELSLLDAREQLKMYIQCVKKFGAILPKATDFMEFQITHKNDIMLLVDCEIDGKVDEDMLVLLED